MRSRWRWIRSGIGAIRHQFAQLKPRIERGEPLSQALATVTVLVALDSGARAVEFARTGEQSGTLPEMLLRHVALETAAVDAFYQQAAQWLPRIVYGVIALWMALGILTSGAFVPNVPKDL
jgi:general secretion pathway protein F